MTILADADRAATKPTDRSSLRAAIVALTAFLTVVDLFATQAILPTLAHAYEVTPAAMSLGDHRGRGHNVIPLSHIFLMKTRDCNLNQPKVLIRSDG